VSWCRGQCVTVEPPVDAAAAPATAEPTNTTVLPTEPAVPTPANTPPVDAPPEAPPAAAPACAVWIGAALEAWATVGVACPVLATLSPRCTDCASAAGACVLAAGDSDFDPVATAPLSFDPDAPAIPPLDLTFVFSDRAVIDRRTGAVLLSATATCNREAPVSVFGTLTQVTPDGVAAGSLSGFGSCDEDGETVWITAQPTEGAFKSGHAAAQGSASASDAGDFVQRSTSSVVQIARSK